MFVPTVSWQSHSEYKTIVERTGKKLSRNSKYHFKDYEVGKSKLANLNLDSAGSYAAKYYSKTVRPAIHQAQILRSMVLFALLFDKTKAGASLTAWVNEVLPGPIALTILIGCSSFDELPPIGS